MKITIEYCVQWNYEPRALSLRSLLDSEFGVLAETIPSSGGVFEVTVNGSLIFSKKQLGRFPNEEEIVQLIREK